ncbi:hypothetical protein ABIB00_003996 [Bradyrhizobium sp. LB14.3]
MSGISQPPAQQLGATRDGLLGPQESPPRFTTLCQSACARAGSAPLGRRCSIAKGRHRHSARRSIYSAFSEACTSMLTSFRTLDPLASRRPSASTKRSYRSPPLARAAGLECSGNAGVEVSQNRMKSATVSSVMSSLRSRRSSTRTIRSSRFPITASRRSESSGERKEPIAASTTSDLDRPPRLAKASSVLNVSGSR